MAVSTDDDEVRQAANDILRACPFMTTASSQNQFSEKGFDSQNERALFEQTGSAAGVTLKKWADLTFEEKQKLMNAVHRITWEEDEDAVLGIATLMKTIGYPGTIKLRAPSTIEEDSTGFTEGAIDVEDFQEYINAQSWAANYYCDGKSPLPKLHDAIRAMEAPALRGILDNKGFGFEEYINSETPGHFAFSNGNFKAYSQTAARQGVSSASFRSSKINGMVLAAARGNAATVKALMDHKGDVNKTDSLGRSPLWWAAVNGHEEVYALLKSKNANFGNLSQENVTEFMNAFLDGKYKAADVEIAKTMMAQAKAAGLKLTFDEQKVNALMKEPEGSPARQIGEELRRYQEGGDATKYLLKAIEEGNTEEVNRLLSQYGANVNVDALPVTNEQGQQTKMAAIQYALEKTQDPAKRQAMVELFLARNPQPKVTKEMVDLANSKAEQAAEGSPEKAISTRLNEVYKQQNPGAIAELRAALKARKLEDVRTSIKKLSGAPQDVQAVFSEQGNAQRYFEAAKTYFAANGENNQPRNKDLSKKFDELLKLQLYIDVPTTNPPRGVDSPEKARDKILEIIAEVEGNSSYTDSLTNEDRQALQILKETHKPKDKAQELRQAIASGRPDRIIAALGSADEETLKILAQEPKLAADCFQVLGKHYKGMDGEPEKDVGKKYVKLASLYKDLADETDETEKSKIQAKIATALQELSATQASISEGEKKALNILQANAGRVEPRTNPANENLDDLLPNSPQPISTQPAVTQPIVTQPVATQTGTTITPAVTPQPVNHVQMGEAMAAAKADEKTPWYKQEWLWWVLAIAAASALGFFAFRKGGWLNKDDKKSTVNTNTNTNDNSNSNSNTNDGSSDNSNSGGTLGSNSECISAKDVNNLLAAGSRVISNDGR